MATSSSFVSFDHLIEAWSPATLVNDIDERPLRRSSA
jgi:hypothetical protein